jgi:hypothetical protein
MNTKRKGNITEAIVIAEFVKRGIPTLIPFGDAETYDICVDLGKIFKIQVKTSQLTDTNAYRLETERIWHNHTEFKSKGYDKNEVDFFATVIGEEVYLIPHNEIPPSLVIHLRVEKPKNGRTKGVRMAHEYHIDKFIETHSSKGE